MSWQPYVDNLVQSQRVDQAVLVSRNGDSIWAQTPGFAPSTVELAAVVKGLSDPSELQANGLRLLGQKYFVVRAEDRSIYAKFQDDSKDDGVVVVGTKQTILIAHFSKPQTAPAAIQVTEAMADYLVSVGY